MKFVKLIVAGLALLLLVAHARAEYRTVLIQTKQDKDQKTSFTIYSDEKGEQKSAISVDEAVKVIAGMKGWGSTVGVYVSTDGKLARADRKKLFAMIDENVWLDLKYFGPDVPKGVGDHFLKDESGKPKEPGGKREKPLPGGNAPLPELVKECKGVLVAILQEVGDPELGPPGASDYVSKWKVERVLRGDYAKTADLSFRVQSFPEKTRETPPTVGKTYILISYEANARQIAVILEADEKNLRLVQDLLRC